MKTLTATLEAAQQSLHRRPHVEALVHDLEQGVGRLPWERVYTGSEPESHHDFAIDGNDRMHRIRVEGTWLYHQRTAASFATAFPATFPIPLADTPNFSSWSLITTGCAGPCAIAASGDKVYIFYRTTGNVVAYYYSHNGGLSWNIGTLASYADVMSMAAAWWTGGTGHNVVCFTLRTNELSAIVWDTDTDSLVVQRIMTFTPPHTHIITNTYGIGATYNDAAVRIQIVFAGRRETTPYDTYELFRTQLSATHYFASLESFVVTPVDPLDPDLLRHEYPDCHVPAAAQDHETPRITMVEKFNGIDPYDRPLTCHVVRDTSFMDTAYTEPRPLVDASSDYGLRMATNELYWFLSRPDGLWRSRRKPPPPVDLTSDIRSFTLRSHAVASGELASSPGTLVLELDNSRGQYNPTNPMNPMNSINLPRAELELRCGYATTAGAEVVEAGRYWIDSWQYNSMALRGGTRAGRSTLTLYCLDGWSLANRWTPRYQLRWNHNGTPHTVWQILYRILARVGIRLVDGAWPRSHGMLNFYPDFTLVPGQRGDAVIRRLLATVPDQLVFRGLDAFVKDPVATEPACYDYGPGDHPVLAGKYGDGVTASRTRAIGRDASDDQVIADAIDWDLQQLYDHLVAIYDPNLADHAAAQERAESVLRSLSLGARPGELLVPTNVGQELLDVIEVSDPRCGIVSRLYRVRSMLTAYDRRIARYDQTLTLGAP